MDEKIECPKCNGKFKKSLYRIIEKEYIEEELLYIYGCPICGEILEKNKIVCPHCDAEFSIDNVLKKIGKISKIVGNIGGIVVYLFGLATIAILYYLIGIIGLIGGILLFILSIAICYRFQLMSETPEIYCPVCNGKLRCPNYKEIWKNNPFPPVEDGR